MSDLSFRDAGASDVPAIVALVESAYRGEAGRKGWTTESDLLDGQRTDDAEVLALVTKPGSRLLVAERGGSLVACCHVQRHDDVCHFGMFSVAPGEQRGGLGKSVLREAERVAVAWGCGVMRMSVIDVRVELVAWYERRGYRRTGVYEPFPYGDARFGLPRRPDLRFEVMDKPIGETLVASR
jgi:ribosomal protein S18 acetylase RimI-like enzyme